MDDGDSIAECETIQIFLECFLGKFAPETIQCPLNNIERPCPPLLTIGREARPLLPIAAVQDRGFQIIRGFALGDDTTGGDIFSAQTDPYVADGNRPHRPRM